jgi:type I restriction enzyme S subunit
LLIIQIRKHLPLYFLDEFFFHTFRSKQHICPPQRNNSTPTNDNLDKIARLLYKDIFTCEDSNIDECKLSDIAFITMGQSPSGSSYNETHDGEVFYQGRTDFGVRFPTRRLFTSEPKRIADEGDILLSVRAPVGDLNIATERCCIGRGLSALRSKEGNQSYLFYTLLSIEDQLNLFNSEGTVFGAINKDSLGNLAIKIHPLEKIRVFESTVQPLDNLIRSNYFEVCKLQLLRDSLLPKLMSGEIDVSDVEI